MRILIQSARLDNKLTTEGDIELKGSVFAHFNDGENNNPSYVVFSKTKEDGYSFDVPKEALNIPHERGGAHGDLRLRYKNANIIFFLEEDFWSFFRLDDSFIASCDIIYSEKGIKFLKKTDGTLEELEPSDKEEERELNNLFLKGGKDLLNKLGVRIS